MKFPSVKSLAESVGSTIKRFPFELLFALAGTIASTIKTELSDVNRVGENLCLRVIIIGNLGLLLTLSGTLFAESRQLSSAKKLLVRIVATIIAIYLLFVINPGIREADYVRFFLLSLGLHLLVAFAAFTKGHQIQGFWQFNKTLFLRFLTSVLYSLVLYGGLAAAIGAMNYLFNFKFEWDTFSILFSWIVGIFSTTFFLAGVPGDFPSLDEDDSYPKGLKVFTQYVLIPLASVYVLILLAYEVKIIIEWNLPKGSVSYLILSYAVFSILSLLLVYPIRNREENKWLKTYSRSFYFLMIPLLLLLFIAAGQRIFSYGVTEFRYFLSSLAVWLLFITVHFLFFKKQNIKIIPVSLCIVALLSIYGPQSAFSVSMYSQRMILADILKRNHAIKDGKFIPIKNINKTDADRASERLDYLVTHHDITSLQPYFNKDLSEVSDSLSKQKNGNEKDFSIENYELRGQKVTWVRDYLDLDKFTKDYNNYKYSVVKFNKSTDYDLRTQSDISDVKGYDFFISAKSYDDTINEVHDGIKFIERESSNNSYSLTINNDTVTFDLTNFMQNFNLKSKDFDKSTKDTTDNNYIVPAKVLMLNKETNHYLVTLQINSLRFNKTKKGIINITYADANYLVKIK